MLCVYLRMCVCICVLFYIATVRVFVHGVCACLVCVKAEQQASPPPTKRINMGDTVKLLCNAGESAKPTPPTTTTTTSLSPFYLCLCHLSLLLPLSLFYSLPGTSAEASTITATSTCLLTVSNSDRRRREREREEERARGDSSCMPATMGENCHNDRGG